MDKLEYTCFLTIAFLLSARFCSTSSSGNNGSCWHDVSFDWFRDWPQQPKMPASSMEELTQNTVGTAFSAAICRPMSAILRPTARRRAASPEAKVLSQSGKSVELTSNNQKATHDGSV
jgi:hypothetical protein